MWALAVFQFLPRNAEARLTGKANLYVTGRSYMLFDVVSMMSQVQAPQENASTQAYLYVGPVALPSRLTDERTACRPEPKCPAHQVGKQFALGDAKSFPTRLGFFSRPYGH